MRTFSFLRSVVLAIYVAFETARSPRKYRELKAAVDSGGSRGPAFALRGNSAVRMDLVPRRHSLPRASRAPPSGLTGWDWWIRVSVRRLPVCGRISTQASLTAWHWCCDHARPDAASSAHGAPRVGETGGCASLTAPAGLHLPLPVTPRECWLFGLVAFSTGICEEVVFRGCPLNALHSVHAEYWTLVALAAIFGAIFTRESRESL
jgi:hypothetical protein